MQNKVKQFNSKYMQPLSAENRMLDIQSEVGELAKEVLKSTDYGTKNFTITPDLKMELGDAIYSLLSFASEHNINAEECLTMVINKYENRFNKKGHIGSN